MEISSNPNFGQFLWNKRRSVIAKSYTCSTLPSVVVRPWNAQYLHLTSKFSLAPPLFSLPAQQISVPWRVSPPSAYLTPLCWWTPKLRFGLRLFVHGSNLNGVFELLFGLLQFQPDRINLQSESAVFCLRLFPHLKKEILNWKWRKGPICTTFNISSINWVGCK